MTLFAVSIAAVGCSDDDDVVDQKPEKPEVPEVPEVMMTFRMAVENIEATAADFTVTPSDLQKNYYADVVPASAFAGMNEEQMIAEVLRNSDKEDLLRGEFKVKAADIQGELTPKTNYILYALGYDNNKVVSELFTKAFTTLEQAVEPEPQPEPEKKAPVVELSSVMDKDANALKFTAKCTSKDATAAKFVCEASAQFDEIFAAMPDTDKETIYAQILEMMGQEMELNALNGEGATILRKDKTNGEKFLFLVEAQNESGKTLKNMEAVFEGATEPEPQPQPGDGKPVVKLEGSFDAAAKVINFTATCTSKNAEQAQYIITVKSMIDNLINDNMNLEDFLASQGDSFSKKMLSDFNAGGAHMVFGQNPDDGFEEGMDWTLLLQAQNAEGKTIERKDVSTVAFNLADKMHAILTVGDSKGQKTESIVTAHFSTDVNNLARCYIAIFQTDELDNALNGGKTLEQMILGAEQNTMDPMVIDRFLNAGQMMHLEFQQLSQETSYTFAWMAYDRDENKGIVRTEACMTTAPSTEPEGPAVYMEVSNSNVFGFSSDSAVSALINSANAVSGKVCCMETDAYFELAATMTPKEIIMQKGKDLTPEEMELVRAGALALVGNFPNLQPLTSYRYGALIFNAEGNSTMVWADTKTTAPLAHGNDAGCPTVNVEGWAGNIDKKFTDINYTIKLQGSEVTEAALLIYPGDMIHQLFEVGTESREIFDTIEMAEPSSIQYLSADDVAKIQSPEGAAFTAQSQPNTLNTPIWRCKNAAGKVAVGYVDVMTTGSSTPDPDPNPQPQPDPDQPGGTEGEVKVALKVTPGDWNGENIETNILASVSCLSKDAAKVWYVQDAKSNIDAELAGGKSYFEIVTTSSHTEKLKEKPFVMNAVNSQDGYNLGVWKQKMDNEYSIVAIIWNAKGEYGIGRIDWTFKGANTESNVPEITPDPQPDPQPNPEPQPEPQPDPQPEQPGSDIKVELKVTPGDWNGENIESNILASIKCPTQNAAKVWFVQDAKSNIDAEIAAGKSIFDVVTTSSRTEKLKEKPFVMNSVNSQDGYNLGVWKQKMGLEYTIIAVIWDAAGNYGEGRIDWTFNAGNTEAHSAEAKAVVTMEMFQFQPVATAYEAENVMKGAKVTRLEAVAPVEFYTVKASKVSMTAAMSEKMSGRKFLRLNINRFNRNF